MARASPFSALERSSASVSPKAAGIKIARTRAMMDVFFMRVKSSYRDFWLCTVFDGNLMGFLTKDYTDGHFEKAFSTANEHE
jgi:hypothetical protein